MRDFLKRVPAVWDDVKFIDGFPGQYVVIARRAGKTWYVAGINADRQQPRKVKIDLKALGVTKQGTLITDGIDFLGFKSETFPLEKRVTVGRDHHAPARRIRAHVRIITAKSGLEIAGFDM